MPNRQLTKEELERLFTPLIDDVRAKLQQLSAGDEALTWALRRKLAKELTYDERGKPMRRKLLKAQIFARQHGNCAACHSPLPPKGSVLDRHEAMTGYTLENTQLLCPACDTQKQEARRYT